MQSRAGELLDLAGDDAGTRAAISRGVQSTKHKPGRTVRITEEMDAVELADLQLDELDGVELVDLETVTGGSATSPQRPPVSTQQQWGKLLPFIRPGTR
jgi:hypothetical protein